MPNLPNIKVYVKHSVVVLVRKTRAKFLKYSNIVLEEKYSKGRRETKNSSIYKISMFVLIFVLRKRQALGITERGGKYINN